MMHCMDHKQLHDLGTADSSINGISRSGQRLHFMMSQMADTCGTASG